MNHQLHKILRNTTKQIVPAPDVPDINRTVEGVGEFRGTIMAGECKESSDGETNVVLRIC